jgi:hypothetical protein
MVMRRNLENEERHVEKRSALATMIFGLLFVAWVGEWSLALDAVMYNGLWRSPFVVLSPLFEPVPGIRLFPWQLLLLALAPVCLVSAGAFQSRARELDWAILLSLVCVAATFMWGLLRGGSAYFAYYQVWRWLTALLVAFLLLSAVRSPRDLAALGKLIVLAALIRATLCIYFYWAHVRANGYNLEYLTNHDDSVVFVTATLVVSCWALIKGGRAAWSTAIVVSLYLSYAMVLNDRRIAWVELLLALGTLYVLMGAGPLRRQITRWMIVATPFVLAYVVIGFSSDAAFFAPIHALASAGSGTDLSSLARQEEIRNLLYTLADFGNPLFGTGWGHPYQKLTNLWSNFGSAWVLADYTPHNSLLGLVVFAGLLGVFGIWGVMPVAALLAARGYRGATAPVPRTAAMVATGVLVVYGVHCYGDIGFSSFAACLFLGAALGTAGKVAAWTETVSADIPAPAPDGNKRVRRFGATAYPDGHGAARSHDARGRREWSAPTQNVSVKPGRMPSRRSPGQ